MFMFRVEKCKLKELFVFKCGLVRLVLGNMEIQFIEWWLIERNEKGGGVDLNSKILESVVEGSRGIVGNSVFVDFFDNRFRYCVDQMVVKVMMINLLEVVRK